MRHARLGLAMSVFQDVTAVPFLVVIPDSTQIELLEALGLAAARLVIVSHGDDAAAPLKTLHQVRSRHPSLPVMVRARDQRESPALLEAGATAVVTEMLGASLGPRHACRVERGALRRPRRCRRRPSS